jgi:hypothetical protein
MSRGLLPAALLLFAAGASADSFSGIAFTPPARDSHTALTAIVSGVAPSSCVPFRGTATISNGTITIAVEPPKVAICLSVVTPWTVPVFIGTLAPGRYDVVTTFGVTVFDRRSIFIADADPPFRIVPNVGLTLGGAVTIYAPLGTVDSLTGATVTFDDVPATISTAAADRLIVIHGPHAAGPVTVKLSIANGPTYTAVGGYRYVDASAPPDRAAYEAILIPLVFAGDGAFQSFWTTELWVHNDNPYEVVQFNGPFIVRACLIGPCLQPIDPHYSLKLNTPPAVSLFPHGRIMYVPRADAAGLNFDLRVRDLNRQGETHGVEIPVARERNLQKDSFSLLNVPGDAQYRSRLRLYSLEKPGGLLTVRVVTMAKFPFVEVASTSVALADPTSDFPAYAELDLDPLISKAAQPGPYRVQIDPPFPRVVPSYWAFVSITNNQTQNVTVVTPQ